MIGAERLPGAGRRLAQLAQPVGLFEELHQSPMGRHITRIDPQCPSVTVDDATIVPQLPGNLGQRAPGLAVSGLESDGLFVLFRRLAQEPPVLADQAQVEAGLGEPGIAVDGLEEAPGRVLQTAGTEVSDTEAVVRLREAGLDFERRAVAFHRGPMVAEFQAGSPQQAVQNQLLGMQGEQVPHLLRQGFELSRPVQFEQRLRGCSVDRAHGPAWERVYAAGWRSSISAPKASRRGSRCASNRRHWSSPSRKMGCRTCSELGVRTLRSVRWK